MMEIHQTSIDPQTAPRWRIAAAAAIIVAAGLVAYFNSFFGQFIYDDVYLTEKNPDVRQLWPPTMLWYDTSAIVWATFSINYALGGFNPVGFHAVNLGIHILASLVLFGVVRRTLLNRRFGGRFDRSATALAGSVAVLWVVHPLCTQAVTYIIQRRESLMGLFYLLTVYLAIRAFDSPQRSRWWLVAAIATCTLGMRSKPVMVTAPVMVLLYDCLFAGRNLRGILRARWWFYLALAATWYLLLPNVPRFHEQGTGMAHLDLTMWNYAMTQFGVILRYLSLAVWPVGQCIGYDWPTAETAARIVPPAVIVLGLFGATIWALFRHPPWGYAGAWFFVILAPTSSFMVIGIPIFEHRMYLSLAAVIAILVLGAYCLGGRVTRRISLSPETLRWVGVGSVVFLAVGLTGLTIDRNTDYYSSERMWADVIESYPTNGLAHFNYAVALAETGQTDKAIFHHRLAIELFPRFARAHNNLGLLLADKGKVDQAIEHYRLAISSDPEMVSTYHNLGLALEGKGLTTSAEESYRHALSIRSDYPQAHNSLGVLLYRRGEYRKAAERYRLALKSEPDFIEALSNLAWLLSACGDEDLRDGSRAVALATRACRATEFQHPGMLEVLSAAYAENGRFDEAIRTAAQALKLIDSQSLPRTAKRLTELIAQYKQSRPCRDAPPN